MRALMFLIHAMKKITTLTLFILSTVLCMAQNYGILVNGNTFFAAEHTEKFEDYEQYVAHVQFSAGDKFVLCNATQDAIWVKPLDPSTVEGFSLEGDTYKCTVSGCFDCYIKLKWGADILYVGPGKNCGTGEPYKPQEVCTPSYGLLVDGQFVEGTQNTAQTNWLEYMISNLTLKAGQTIKLYDVCTKAQWIVEKYAETSYQFQFTEDQSSYLVTEDGEYDFYIKFIYQNDEVYVHKHGTEPEPQPGSSVPSECGDVMMQGFYWDSYKVDDEETMTSEFGDTRWRSMLTRAEEIGAYFDLVWLPPSAYASGTGYHPRQYSNQNSDWGSRAELEKLIASFHNSGTKVVADMVVNHVEAMASWCDFAPVDFGEYGRFEIDGSYICTDDEMNDPYNKQDTLAGKCWGSASGPYDDGYDGEQNYTAARDLAHDSEKVREMCRAYAKWLINVMHYDGFRYDYCKGFHASHINDYNRAGGAYISFMEMWSGNENIIRNIRDAQMNTMALDFQTKYQAFDGIAAFDYGRCKGSGLLGAGMSKYAVTFIDSHDWFLRDNGQEFGGNGNSMKPELKDRLLQANAFLLSMPGIPCVFYPHWAKYKEEIKPMINARHLAGVHSESPVTDEYAEKDGYQCTVHGHNGYLILCLGNKANNTFNGYTKVASGKGYAIWVQATNDVAPGIIATQSTTFEDLENGITVTMQAVGGSRQATLYYTTDGTDPTTESEQYTGPLTFKETTTLKVMAVCGTAQSKVQTYTYTYREPLAQGIQVHFKKPAIWEKVYLYAWIPGVDEHGEATSTNLMGAFPGRRIYQDAEGWYSYEFDADMDSVNFCINSGRDCGGINVESNHLMADYHVYYEWEEGHETESKYEKEITTVVDLNPDFDLVISPESSSFNDKEEGIRVSLNIVGRPGAVIYYSIDGSDPNDCADPKMDSVSFVVKETTIVRAFAYDAATKTKTQEYANTFTYQPPQSGPLNVKFFKPHEWSSLYLYAFTRIKKGGKNIDTPYALDGIHSKWPGIPWTTFQTIGNDSVYYFQMKDDLQEIYVIFTEGNKKPQTQDIFLDANTCYYWNPDCSQAIVSPDCDGTNPVDEIEEDNSSAVLNPAEPMYNILGQEVDASYNGVVIQNGRKFLNIKQ